MAIKKLDSRMVQVPATIEQLNTTNLSSSYVNVNNIDVINGLTVYGTITALSGFAIVQASTTSTSALSVSNLQNIPALTVSQGIASPVVADFRYNNNTVTSITKDAVVTNSVVSPEITSTNVYTKNLYMQGGGIVNDTIIYGGLTVYGAVTALSGILNIQTATSTTSSLSVFGTGTGPAAGFTQVGTFNIAEFEGGDGKKVLTVLNSFGNTGPYVTVSGPVSAAGIVYAGSTSSNDWDVASNRATQFANVSSKYESVYTTVNQSSAALTTLQTASSKYESVYTTVNQSSAALTTLQTASSKYESTFTTVNTNSSTWGLKYSLVDMDFTAAANNSYLVNTASLVLTATLPSVPLTGDTIQFQDPFSTWDNNLFVIFRNGNNIESSAENLFCNIADSRFTLTFVGSARGWKIST